MAFVTQPEPQIALDLSQRNANLGNLDLDVLRAVLADILRTVEGMALRIVPDRADLVGQIVGDDLAGDAALGKLRRHREGIDHHAVGLGRIPRRRAQPDEDGRADHDRHHLQRRLDAVAESAQPQS